MADVDTTFEHDVFDLAQRQRIADVHHHRETDDLGRAVKITKGIVHYHRLREVPLQLNPIFSDNALARDGDDTAIFEHINAYADNSGLLENLLRALSATAEETPERAATGRRIWPKVVRHVLELNDSGHMPFQRGHFGDMALSALAPNSAGEVSYLYREINARPIVWWTAMELKPEVEAWLELAVGNPWCVDRLVGFISVLGSDDQIRIALPWVEKLVLANPERVACRSYMLATWLIEMRSAAADAGLLTILAASRRCSGCRGRNSNWHPIRISLASWA